MKYLKLFEEFQEADIPHGTGNELNYGNLDEKSINVLKPYFEDLKMKCKENNIKLKLVNDTGVDYGKSDFKTNGYFDDNTFGEGDVLACAIGKDIKYWLPVLLHESCHMDQYLEKVPTWVNNKGLVKTDEWLSGKEIDKEIIDEEIRTGMDVEIDCEKRTFQKIKDWKLESIIDTADYARNANAYILFYHWMRKNRKWYEIGKEPYNIPEILREMPTDFNVDYSFLPEKIEKLYDKYLN